jgi:hypothetical protein
LPIPVHLRVHVRVAVDKSRGHDQAVGVDGSLRGGPNSADLNDPAVRDTYVGAIPPHAGTVDDRAVADDEVQGHG